MSRNRTDMRCLVRLFFGGPATAKDLAAATRLAPGALTTVLARLERCAVADNIEQASRHRVRRVGSGASRPRRSPPPPSHFVDPPDKSHPLSLGVGP